MKFVLITIGLVICISRSPNETHTFLEPEEGIGHVSVGTGFLDTYNSAADDCDSSHRYEECTTFCFESRGDE